MAIFDTGWPCLEQNGPVWYRVVMSGTGWPCLVQGGHVWYSVDMFSSGEASVSQGPVMFVCG